MKNTLVPENAKTKKQTEMTIRNICLRFSFAVLLLASAQQVDAQWPDWPVPDTEAAVENPVAVTPNAINNGRLLYDMQCAACHGSRGLGDGAIAAPNMTTEAFALQSDGAIFWKLQQGRGQMPSFASLPDEQLWEVIHFLRTFTAPLAEAVKKKSELILKLSEVDGIQKVMVQAFEVDDLGSKAPLPDVRISMGVQRMFGVLPFTNQAAFTNEEGIVEAVFPGDLPADTAGNVLITAFIDDPGYEPSQVDQQVQWGTTWEFVDITQKRTLWGTMSSVPLWLLFSFLAIAGMIGLTILFVMLDLKKINDLGKKKMKAQISSQT
jgi:mono/diheme cytochrome c family protein